MAKLKIKKSKDKENKGASKFADMIARCEAKYGQGAVSQGDQGPHLDIAAIPTGILSVDNMIGIGGIPKGRIIEIYGPEASGKTTMTLHIASECQKQGGTIGFIDTEHALDASYARKLGIDFGDKWLMAQPDCGEDALGICGEMVDAGIDLIIVDSVAALVPRAELEGEIGDSHMGRAARMMSQALRMLCGKIKKAGATVIFINQLRKKIGISFGNPNVTTGGESLKYYCSLRMQISRTGKVNEAGLTVGQTSKVQIIKNKVGPAYRDQEVTMIYGKGVDKAVDLIELAVEAKIIKKSGSWFAYNDGKLGQGLSKVKLLFEEQPDLMEEIKQKVIKYQNGELEEETPEATAEAPADGATPEGTSEAPANTEPTSDGSGEGPEATPPS